MADFQVEIEFVIHKRTSCLCVSVPYDGVQTWVCELCCSVVVVHKIDPARHGASNLPSHRQRAELLTPHAGQIPAPVTENQPISKQHQCTARMQLNKTFL